MDRPQQLHDHDDQARTGWGPGQRWWVALRTRRHTMKRASTHPASVGPLRTGAQRDRAGRSRRGRPRLGRNPDARRLRERYDVVGRRPRWRAFSSRLGSGRLVGLAGAKLVSQAGSELAEESWYRTSTITRARTGRLAGDVRSVVTLTSVVSRCRPGWSRSSRWRYRAARLLARCVESPPAQRPCPFRRLRDPGYVTVIGSSLTLTRPLKALNDSPS